MNMMDSTAPNGGPEAVGVRASKYTTRFIECDPENRIFRVNREAYTSPDVFEQEKRKVLYKSWLVLGHESEVANKGDFVTRTVIDKDLIFNRDGSGQVNVFYNTCLHRGPAVCKESAGNARTFACPYHGWVYRNSGELVSLGSKKADACYPDHYLKPGGINLVRVKNVAQRAGFYFINFDDDAMPLDEFLGAAGARLDRIAKQSQDGFEIVAGLHEYEISANYKLLVENSLDGYHLMSTHATYFAYMADLLKGADPKIGGHVMTLGNGHASFMTPVMSGRPIAQWLPHWGEEAKRAVEEKRNEIVARLGEEEASDVCDYSSNTWIFPISIINDQQTILIRAILPISHNKMRVRAWSLAPKGESPKLREIRMENTLSFLGPGGFATPDDITMLEWAQRAYEHTCGGWNDFSKAMKPDEDTLNSVAVYDDELHMRAYWVQWDKMMSAE